MTSDILYTGTDLTKFVWDLQPGLQELCRQLSMEISSTII